ncbi:MarR family transcriptional regulator [Streptomyces ambofaciens]|uniref:MarR family transcriptional regulator n=1 Tax=Streptomyces ambofaciens TaxID=1889 RepID=A0ABM6B8Y8_STRAM|nr:MarR family winged helix-turn-helix transcriptional regulator [Streptomyces ambofaciens]ANB10579.1 MarR family transcriptional regulator [Streptomyces ambofaciens]
MTRLGGSGDDRASESGDGPEAVALEIADAVERLTTLWSIASQQAELRLSSHQLRALRALEVMPGTNLTVLAERLDIGLPTASRLCDRLEAAGLLERSSHPQKRREVRLGLSVQGRRVLGEVGQLRVRAIAAALVAVEPGDRAALSRGMKAFLAAQDAGDEA